MLLADLKSMAAGMGIPGAGSMKKAQLVEAIKAAQSGAQSTAPSGAQSAASPAAQPAGESTAPRVTRTQRPARRSAAPQQQGAQQAEQPAGQPAGQPESTQGDQPAPQTTGDSGTDGGADREPRSSRQRTRSQGRQQDDAGQESGQDGQRRPDDRQQDQRRDDQPAQGRQEGRQDNRQERQDENRDRGQDRRQDNRQDGRQDKGQQQEQKGRDQQQDEKGQRQDRQQQDRQQQGKQGAQQGGQQGGQDHADHQDDDGEGGSRRNRRRRGRDRDRDRAASRPGSRNEPDTTVLEDDVLVPAAGILDVLDNYAFVRTSGYLPGTDDVYLSLSMVRKFGLRRGDAIVGQVRQPREGERKEKFNPMVRIDSVNGADPEAARDRAEFDAFTPVHPDDRLRLETDPGNLVGRMIDLAAPIGKGQRGLLLAPPDAGTTTVLQSIAGSITRNNPDCHLMIVLVDVRPEEVTDFQRSVKGEVIASTFDRPATDHTAVAELAIERAKRLVELGHDVVVLLDSLTRLGRAYNLAAPANGRVLAGSVDATALHPPKRFFGAARNIEQGGSLTILATALVDTGSTTDEVILEEFTGTANSVLRLSGDIAARRTHPAIDVLASGTRREDLLLTREELEIVEKLRRSLLDRTPLEAQEDVLGRVRATQSNIELLTQVQRAPAAGSAKRR